MVPVAHPGVGTRAYICIGGGCRSADGAGGAEGANGTVVAVVVGVGDPVTSPVPPTTVVTTAVGRAPPSTGDRLRSQADALRAAATATAAAKPHFLMINLPCVVA